MKWQVYKLRTNTSLTVWILKPAGQIQMVYIFSQFDLKSVNYITICTLKKNGLINTQSFVRVCSISQQCSCKVREHREM